MAAAHETAVQITAEGVPVVGAFHSVTTIAHRAVAKAGARMRRPCAPSPGMIDCDTPCHPSGRGGDPLANRPPRTFLYSISTLHAACGLKPSPTTPPCAWAIDLRSHRRSDGTDLGVVGGAKIEPSRVLNEWLGGFWFLHRMLS
jgi:hypothetical protein